MTDDVLAFQLAALLEFGFALVLIRLHLRKANRRDNAGEMEDKPIARKLLIIAAEMEEVASEERAKAPRKE